MQRITGLNIKCVFIIFKNIFARIVKVVRFVFIIFKDVFAKFVMVQKFVFIIFKDVFAKFVQTQLKLPFEIGFLIQRNLIRKEIIMIQIDSLTYAF